jgi:hypothetical protein
MNTRILTLTCVLGAAACGGSDNRPAQDPTATTTVEPTRSSPVSSSTTTVSTTRTTSGAESTRLDARDTTANDGVQPYAAVDAAPTPGATPPPAPVVGNNPGVADQTKAADNTKINDRDRHGALTPTDQGNSRSETQITADIRKGVMADKSLSFTAKNVKIITVGNKVTLRGPVHSDQEKSAIEAVAKKTSGVSEVDNQIEVKK